MNTLKEELLEARKNLLARRAALEPRIYAAAGRVIQDELRRKIGDIDSQLEGIEADLQAGGWGGPGERRFDD